ncbi:pentapeptide repeat-containing protein [Bradyrhizobium sp. U87765 SZCCT0131]|uniref:pentapeptide repeat-containing protein n=1 Tax=unclassified Bradyrhizobium TaxID=2631580 RepID=UPI001BA6E8A2|nr:MULTISPECIES: pentapeptide repeat-containing protein [unclassified Bradyrhizobium]MBR1220840.1 pentapeptide repeat-containing protein [Bradyrhizobium sp. U87765 SZCCT0131]MBR1260340.1 pentapeptide repeat-containing protein [Bradyrhizobium sp. U87765 SZCCT0134]MBR1307411.1 pentapeptide repeat-containing protein [Bradyrhizobium sp. U87765 SZCCT0110]MBR1321365.1 pentapeptide repeat-containing protein [Bradyrhizobium sp. U87765 SZCCT0109]MBR1349678.1 pentapeptide repeat-containing protein [Brad
MFRILRAAAIVTALEAASLVATGLVAASFVAASLIAASLAGPTTARAAPDEPPNKGQSYTCDNVSNSGTDFTHAATAGQNYAGQNLRNANFSGTNLAGTVFDGADLTGANLTGTTLGAANGQMTSFSQANLTNACLQGATIQGTTSAPGASFQFANLTCAAVTDSDITAAVFGPVITAAPTGGVCRTTFANTRMTCEFLAQWNVLDLSFADVSACKTQLAGLNLSGAVMVGVQFPYYNLAQTNFSNANLTAANFYSATLSNALFTAANLQFATLSSVVANSADFTGQARLSGATLSYGNFESAKFNNAVFEASNKIPGATMSFGNFHNANFTLAAMVGVNLSGSLLYDGTIMSSATIQNANLANTTLWNLALPNAKLSGITFDNANLINANLSGATLTNNGTYRPASMVKTNLQGVNLTSASLGGVNMTNAAVALQSGVPLFKQTANVSDLIGDLNKGWLTTELAQMFESNGFALSACDSPGVAVVQKNQTWNLALRQKKPVGPSGDAYHDFILKAVVSNSVVTGLTVSGYADQVAKQLFSIDGDFTAALNAQTLPRAVLEAFDSAHYALPPCADPTIATFKVGNYWTVATNANSYVAPVVGYTGFKIVDTGGTQLQVYGTAITTVYQGDDGRLQFTSFTVATTRLNADSFTPTTVMPNGNTYGANLAANISLDDMLTAPTPPPPPTRAPGSAGH